MGDVYVEPSFVDLNICCNECGSNDMINISVFDEKELLRELQNFRDDGWIFKVSKDAKKNTFERELFCYCSEECLKKFDPDNEFLSDFDLKDAYFDEFEPLDVTV